MIKIVVVFLMLLLIVSMIGNLVTKFLNPPADPPKVQTKAKCAHCGRTVIGTAPCICGKG